MLEGVSQGVEPETLRIYVPTRIVSFGPQDLRAPGYSKAVEAARAGGFEAVQRLGGGRAAVFHEGTIAFAWTVHDPTPGAGVDARFEEVADMMAGAFRGLGVDAHVGEVPGEYCPGSYSVNARGQKKLMGVGQRLRRGAAHVGGVVVVTGGQTVRDILIPVYDALELTWDPDTVGSIADEVGEIGVDDVQAAILDAFAERYDLYDVSVSGDLLARAEQLAPEHVAPTRVASPRTTA